MKAIPQEVSESTRKRNPHLYDPHYQLLCDVSCHGTMNEPPKPIKPRLNKTETRWKAVLESRGVTGIMEQAITLRLDPPFKSYKPDLAYHTPTGGLCFVEVKGPHRFRKAGIAKAALAAKTYPQFRFELADWTGKEWKESVLSP